MTNTKLKTTSLNWARKHLSKESDTDLFPTPFEIDVIKDQWTTILPELEKTELSSHQWQCPRSVLVPKSNLSFRRATQLDPIDSILFAALIKELGSKIEKRRVPVDQKQVFSYRFKPKPSGIFFDNLNAWENFWERSKTLASGSKYVLLTDITDFYNQVYHHVITQQLQLSEVPKPFIKAIENLLNRITETVSRGLAVGPHGMHLLAEMSLIPIDEFLRLKNIQYCRYVDDVHIFVQSEEDAQIALALFADVLDRQKILPNSGKTKILKNTEFISLAERMVIHEPINQAEEELISIIRSRVSDPYAQISLRSLQPDDIGKFSDATRIKQIFDAYLGEAEPNFVRVRWFIRRITQVGAPGGVEYVVENLHRLLPAIGEVTGYLRAAKKNYSGKWEEIGLKLLNALELPLVKANEYLHMVIMSLFSRITDLNQIQSLIGLYETSGPLSRRKVVLAAVQAKAASWLSQLKKTASNSDPWLWRAIVYSAQVFSPDEAKHWLQHVKKHSSELEKAIAEFAKKRAK